VLLLSCFGDRTIIVRVEVIWSEVSSSGEISARESGNRVGAMSRVATPEQLRDATIFVEKIQVDGAHRTIERPSRK
jgi:hypothetical protein